MAQPALRPPDLTGSLPGHAISLATLAGLTALCMLVLVGARNSITLSVVPGVAALMPLSLDSYNARRLDSRGSLLHRRVWTALLGSAVLVAALVVFSAT
ncbi:MAG: hypothetical protein Q7T55_01380 [Solirubrobacteraceae bacterium]|nr:hypothetical protein [Solirubrobacteraceae bacterium]